MSIIRELIGKIKNRNASNDVMYEFCPKCDANLTLQKGYSNELPYWNCRGCGEMLINPAIDAEDDIVWVCDECGDMLNIQEGFSCDKGTWACTNCGAMNTVTLSELYLSEDEYQSSLSNPYKGLSDEAVLEISMYEEIESVNGRSDIFLVRNTEDEKLYVKKYLKEYELSLYKYLQEHPVYHMPHLIGVYEGANNLVIIEEYISGRTVAELLEEKCFSQEFAVFVAVEICRILNILHRMDNPIIHRDIKPSNIIITDDGEVYLLDVNAAKWYKAEETEDTRLFGTLYYAAPEQFGYGFSASSEKTDIYAVGVLLNVMLTGKLPKEKRADGPIWNVIEKCISLQPDDRFCAEELIENLRQGVF